MYEGIAKSSTVVQVGERESTNTVVIQDGFRPTIDWNLQGIQEKELVSVVDNCGNAHWPTQFEKMGRCKLCYQNKRHREMKLGCKQCDIYLSVDDNCFAKYNSQLLQ
jgi:hypothetical protein